MASATLFAACEGILARCRAAEDADRPQEVQALRRAIRQCPGRALSSCPLAERCRERMPDRVREEPGLSVNGMPTGRGLLQTISLQSPAGDTAHVEVLDLDLARAYETVRLRRFLSMYEQKQQPGWSDFDGALADRQGWSHWLAMASFEDTGDKFYRRYPEGMRRTIGAYYQGSTGEALPPTGKDVFRQLSDQVRARRAPVYCRFTRTWIDGRKIKRFVMRRLEVPVFGTARVAGSLIYLVPEEWSVLPAAAA